MGLPKKKRKKWRKSWKKLKFKQPNYIKSGNKEKLKMPKGPNKMNWTKRGKKKRLKLRRNVKMILRNAILLIKVNTKDGKNRL